MGSRESAAWPTFQFDAGNTGNRPRTPPVTAPVSVAWRYRGQREALWPPVVADETVYAGTFNDDLVALEASSGRIDWQTSFKSGVSSPLAIAEDTLLVGTWDGRGVHALDRHTGRDLWYRDLPGAIFGITAVVDQTAYLSAGYSVLVALDLTDGTKRWMYTTARPEPRPTYPDYATFPAYEDDTVYLGNPAGLFAVDAETGDQQWERSGRYLTVTVRDGLVFAVDTNDERLYAIDTSGRIRWQTRTGGNGRVQSVAATDDTIYMSSQYFSAATVLALERATGRERWRTELDGYGSLCSPPVVVGDTVYVGTGDGILYALDGANGSIHWQVDLEYEILAPPAIANGTVFVGTNGGGYAAITEASG